MPRTLIIILFLILVILYSYFVSKMTHYECPKCGTHFDKNGWDLLKPHFFGKREEKCPNCGQSTFMIRHIGKN